MAVEQLERNWVDSAGIAIQDFITLMTYPTVPVNLVNMYVAAKRSVVKFVGLTPTCADKFSSPLVKNI